MRFLLNLVLNIPQGKDALGKTCMHETEGHEQKEGNIILGQKKNNMKGID